MTTLELPPQLQVFVRDWLSSNNVLLRSREENVLIDSGYGRDREMTLGLVARALEGEPLAKVVNTHCHSDHMGGNAALARAHACAIAVPAGEAALIEAWDDKALLLDYAGQQAERFAFDEVLQPGSSHRWGGLEWRALAAPGHDMGALVFFNPEHRILVSGDALWENGFGFVMPAEIDPRAWPATRATLEMIARLDARVVIPGHGKPFAEVDAAIERAFRRLDALSADPVRTARNAIKVVFAFNLLDRRSQRLAELPAYFEAVGLFRDLNARFLRVPAASLAQRVVAELEAAGVVVRRDGVLLPA